MMKQIQFNLSPRNLICRWCMLAAIICVPLLSMAQNETVYAFATGSSKDQKEGEKIRPLADVLKDVEKHYGIRFALNDKVVENKFVNQNKVPYDNLENTLNTVLNAVDLKYLKVEGYYVVQPANKKKEIKKVEKLKSFNDPLSGNQERREIPNDIFNDGSSFQKLSVKDVLIRGKVTSQEEGSVLPGVNIIVKGTTIGTTSDANGDYTLSVPDANSTLVFSFIGYSTQEVALNGRSVVDAALAADVQQLSEIVVIGYGTAKKSDVTGSLIRVDESELQSRPVANAFEAMQGKAAGVDITSNERPGEIGSVNIRGVRSLTASNTPLYVIDGIPLMTASGIETLNPRDIESIDVLKDASATAIYGSRGANGVILVTTKKGKEGKVSLNYAATMTVETLEDRTTMMSASEYLTWRRWAYHYLNPAVYPRGDQPTQANDYNIFLGARDPYAWNNILQGWSSGTWDGSQVKTTDWTDMVTQTGISTEHNLSASGGSEKFRAYGSFGYLNYEGTMKGQEYVRYTSKVSVDLNPLKWFEMGLSVNSTYSIQQFGQSNTGGQVSGPASIYAAANSNFPYAVPYDDNGNRIVNPGGDDLIKTPVNEWLYSEDQRKTFRALGSLYAQVSILPNLKYRMNFGPDFRIYKNGVYIDKESVNRVGSPNYASLGNQNEFSWTLDNLIFYDKSFGKHNINTTFLQTTSSYDSTGSYMQGTNIPVPSQKWNALNNDNVSALERWDSDLIEKQLMSFMARINYTFADKYIATFSGRWDGASQLAEGRKWEFFPSAALAWRMEQEEWIKSVSWISQLKIRFGVGTTGNSAIKPYQTQGGIVSLFYPYASAANSGYVPYENLITGGNVAMSHQNLGWEKTTQYNLGFDFSLWKDRLSGAIDLYTSRTKDLLMLMAIPSLNGHSTTFSNIGETKNRGVDVTINTVNIQVNNFRWTTTLNAAWQKDEIVSLANGKEDDISNLWFIGSPINVVYNYESAGLWKEEDSEEMAKFNANGHKFQAGMARPVDQNEDYRIDPNNDRKIIGHTRPQWTTGMTNSVTYKNFDFSIFIYGRLGYTHNTNGEWQGGRYVQRSISYYNENNKNAEYQKPIYNVAGGDPYYSILGYKSGSFIKIRNINLGYTLPAELTNKIGFQSLNIYVQAKNPGMLYSKIDWLDLDLGGSTWNRGFVVGINAGL